MGKMVINNQSQNLAKRMYFIDNLRVFLIMFVVAHHVGQAYGPTGGEWPIFNDTRSAILGPFFPVNAAFFMGLFFLISGYFLPGAYDRKGVRVFLKERLMRLGIPLLFLGLLVFGPFAYTGYVSEGGQLSFLPFYFGIYLGKLQIEWAHMWFVAHLLVYAIGYAIFRLVKKRRNPEKGNEASSVPGSGIILAFTLGLALSTAVIRIWFPIDRWVRLFFLVPSEIAHLPQYFCLFGLGIMAYRRDWFRRLPARTGYLWFWIGLSAALLRYFYGYTVGSLLPSITATGGFNWRSLIWSTWEAFICAGLCVGLIVLFREKINKQGKLMSILSSCAYSVYIIHVLVVVAFQFSLAQVSLPPFSKFVLVTAASIPTCFFLSYLLKKLPFTKNIL